MSYKPAGKFADVLILSPFPPPSVANNRRKKKGRRRISHVATHTRNAVCKCVQSSREHFPAGPVFTLSSVPRFTRVSRMHIRKHKHTVLQRNRGRVSERRPTHRPPRVHRCNDRSPGVAWPEATSQRMSRSTAYE